MRKKWRLKNNADIYVIVRRSEVFPEELGAGQPLILSAEIDRWLSDPLSRQTLLDLYENVHGRTATNINHAKPGELHKTLKPWLEQAIRQRELVAIPVPRASMSRGHNSEEASEEQEVVAPRPAAHQSKSKTWIEIELVDARGAPVPRERFRLELPDGTFHEDSLDEFGRARVDGIDPGTCELNFMNRDLNEWQAA